MSISRLFLLTLILIFSIGAVWGRSKKAGTPPPQDQIEVLSSVPVNSDPIVRFTVTQHYNRDYLYAEHASGRELTLIDVTDPRHPQLIANLDLGAQGSSASLLAAAGDAALISSNASAAARSLPQPVSQTITIVNFADRTHPATVRQFTNVSSITSENRLGLIFLADPKGIWVLKRHLAEDPAELERYAQYILHNN